LGNAYQSLGELLSGAEALESLRAAVTACQNALQVYTKESNPQAWAATQNNLGNAYRSLGERLSGREALESLRAAVTADQNALLVFTKQSLPQNWAMTQKSLAKAYVSQERWEDAVQAWESVLTVYPGFIEGLVSAEGIYQDRLFRFDRAFELNSRRVDLGDGELDFIEKHLTTARFESCATRAAALRTDILEKDQQIVLMALRFACLAANEKTEDARAVGYELVKNVFALKQVHWTFRGVKHFVSQHPAFATKAAVWVRLFDALDQRLELEARASLAALGVPE
jgi:tetratricopeptide (TPR) repeat protein